MTYTEKTLANAAWPYWEAEGELAQGEARGEGAAGLVLLNLLTER